MCRPQRAARADEVVRAARVLVRRESRQILAALRDPTVAVLATLEQAVLGHHSHPLAVRQEQAAGRVALLVKPVRAAKPARPPAVPPIAARFSSSTRTLELNAQKPELATPMRRASRRMIVGPVMAASETAAPVVACRFAAPATTFAAKALIAQSVHCATNPVEKRTTKPPR